jgi:transposase InsO family protein
VAAHLLQEDCTAQRPNRVRVCDITEIGADQGWLDPAVVLDLSSRKVVGWAMSERRVATRVCDALRRALVRRKRPRGLTMHTDRGSPHCSCGIAPCSTCTVSPPA